MSIHVTFNNKKFIIFCLFLLPLGGCYHSVAEKMIKAPNYGMTLDQVDEYYPSQYKRLQIDDHFKVQGSEAGIFLDVGVIEPKKQWQFVTQSDGSQKKDTKMPKKLYWERCPDAAFSGLGMLFKSDPGNDDLWHNVRGTVIMVHGLWMNKTYYSLGWAHILSVYGYRVIVVDLRGHGRSTGDYITFGSKESDDIVCLIDSLDDAGLIEGNLYLFGESLGAAVSLETAAKDKRVDGVIAISSFATIRDAAPDFSKQCFSFLHFCLGEKGIDRVIDEAGMVGGFDPDANTPLDAVKELEVPVLFIHGSDDKHVPCEHSQRLSKACRLSSLEIIEGKGHMNVAFENVYSLRDKIISWLDGIER